MQIRIELDESVLETEFIIRTSQVTNEVNDLIKKVSEQSPPTSFWFPRWKS
jgi:hypothetical protein